MPPSARKSGTKFYCPYCPTVVSWKDSLKRHIGIKHNDNAIFFECPSSSCGQRYTSRDSLRRHIKLKHVNDNTLTVYKSTIKDRKAPKRKKSGYTIVKDKQGKSHKRKRRVEWSKEEKVLFEKLSALHDKNWKLIAENIPTKTAVQVRTHAYTRIRKKAPRPTEGYKYDVKAAKLASDKILVEEEAKKSQSIVENNIILKQTYV